MPSKFPEVELDAVIVMPNHLHGLVVIHVANAQQKMSLNTVMQWFKIATTNAYIRGVKKQGWESFAGKVWQRSFHDHIIRSEQDMDTRRQYVYNNPARWQHDENNLP
ncbi:MAG: transposase [Anaerolineae bacterium]